MGHGLTAATAEGINKSSAFSKGAVYVERGRRGGREEREKKKMKLPLPCARWDEELESLSRQSAPTDDELRAEKKGSS